MLRETVSSEFGAEVELRLATLQGEPSRTLRPPQTLVASPDFGGVDLLSCYSRTSVARVLTF